MKKKILFGIIGAGNRGGGFALTLAEREDTEVSALCDPNPIRMKVQARNLSKEPRQYATVKDMLNSEKLDVVIITSPDYCHEPNAVAALKANIMVFIDKPLATTAAGCLNIIMASDKNKIPTMMGFNLRHDKTLAKVKEIVDRGDLGKVILIENREFYNGGRTYLSRWNGKQKYSGGLWIHKGSHDFDIFNWINKGGKPVRVAAFAEISALRKDMLPFKLKQGKNIGPTCSLCYYKSICPDSITINQNLYGEKAHDADGYSPDVCMYDSDSDVYDNGIALVEYDNGVRASHFECFVTSMGDRIYTVVGTRGQLSASLHSRKIEIRPRWSNDVHLIEVGKVEGGHGGADTGILDRIVKVARKEEEPSSTLKDGIFSVAIGDAAERSWREHRMVEISEFVNLDDPVIHRH